MKTVFGGLAVLSFLLMLGTVGGMDMETLGMFPGMAQGLLFMGLTALFTALAGGFKEERE